MKSLIAVWIEVETEEDDLKSDNTHRIIKKGMEDMIDVWLQENDYPSDFIQENINSELIGVRVKRSERINIMDELFYVEYGCYEWQDEESFSDYNEALKRFESITEYPVVMGWDAMDYAILKDNNLKTLRSWKDDDYE